VIVVRMGPGSGWDPAEQSRGQRLWTEHAAFMDDLFRRGLIELAGPFADGSGALVVVRAESPSLVRSWFDADPWTVHDILPVREVLEWTVFLDGRTGQPLRPAGSG
jgi:uncharacterized protein YciI